MSVGNQWNLKQQFLDKVKSLGGFVSCHAHFDKAFYITKEGLDRSMVTMEEKWNMSDDIKKNSTQEDIANRLRLALDLMIAQGTKRCCSFIDAYSAVDHRAIDASVQVKEEYKDKIEFLTATQPLGSLADPKELELYEAITAKADIVGGLPSKDRPNNCIHHYEQLFRIAKNLNKPVHIHIDQENNPNERDTETLIEQTIKHGFQGRVVAVHAISVSAHDKKYRTEIYKKMADAGIAVIVCPSAALGMKQLDQFQAPVHNSIANVPEMLEAGVLVGMGVDNVADFYHPFVDADMWVETRILMEACRYYDLDQLAEIVTTNGHKILDIK